MVLIIFTLSFLPSLADFTAIVFALSNLSSPFAYTSEDTQNWLHPCGLGHVGSRAVSRLSFHPSTEAEDSGRCWCLFPSSLPHLSFLLLSVMQAGTRISLSKFHFDFVTFPFKKMPWLPIVTNRTHFSVCSRLCQLPAHIHSSPLKFMWFDAGLSTSLVLSLLLSLFHRSSHIHIFPFFTSHPGFPSPMSLIIILLCISCNFHIM